ncbi:MAG: ABC transporter substrate-binding protein [Chloroflexi bacterium]|nr:ABC transporter substrate-binding protein [Chloroflexota bacterium]MXZ46576.1 ABC transporter substrate-binding protein [Chloroflexota bacterium]
MAIDQEERVSGWWTHSVGRRTLLRGGLLGGVGLAAAALIGCGGDDDDDDDDGAASTTTTTTTTTTTSTAQATATAAPSVNVTQDDDDDDEDGQAEEAETLGELVQDPALPYPYNFPEPNKTPQPGGIMKVAATWNFQSIDPIDSAAGGTVTVPNMVYNRLIGFKRGPAADVFQPEIEPELAASWERSPDGLTFTFAIQPHATWQNIAPLNGRKFTAEDAAFALNRYATEGVHKSYYANVAGFEAVDDETFKINMAQATADFLNPLASNKQTIFPRELVDDDSIETNAIGTGPMILESLELGQNVLFSRNPDYWEKEVLLDGFEFRIMPDHPARLAQFRVGNIDYAYGVVSTVRDLNELLETNPDVQVNFIPITYNSISMGINHTLEKYQDVRVRRALAMAVDRQEMVDIVFDGLGKAQNIIPWPFLFDEEKSVGSPEVGPYLQYNPDEARKLLAAAGAEGFTMNNSYYAYTSALEQMTEITYSQLARVGINMTGGKVDYTEFNSQWVPSKLPDFSTSAWSTSGYDADNWFHGQVHSQSPGNRWRTNDAEIDEWAEAQQIELDPAARADIWRKIWDKDLDQAYRPTLPWGFSLEVYQPWVRGLRFTGTAPGDNNSYYTWGDQVHSAWIDPDIEGRS